MITFNIKKRRHKKAKSPLENDLSRNFGTKAQKPTFDFEQIAQGGFDTI